jgi:RHS repeat-associated protein
MDWEPRPQETLADREAELLEAAVYRTTASYDALNRIKRMQLPQDVEGKRRELRPTYNKAGGLEKVFLDDTLYVERIAYDAKGQRALIAYGNGVMTRYAYDPQTFRLKRLRSERYSKPDEVTYHPGGEALQDFGYDYDLVGNIVGIRDRAPGSGIRNNPEAAVVSDPALAQLLITGDALNRRFDYDPVYRLLSATGRECDQPPDGEPWQDQPRCTDLTKARAYTERYAYDAMGNLLRLEHRNDIGGFTREFTVETANNRLREMKIGETPYAYAFDANGNMLSETTSRHFEWNHVDQMKAFRTQTEGAEPSVHAHYFYDAAGQRVKKLVRKQGGQVEVTHYIDGAFEHHRWGSGAPAGENNHVHVMDDMQRIALVRIGNARPEDKGPAVQFHLGDHLGSSNVVVNADGALVNREEFTPYGETSFGSFAKKRYRFTGKERDEESGLNYHGARYYAAWFGRWVSCDPSGAVGGVNLYRYSRNKPVALVDPSGMSPSDDPIDKAARAEAAQSVKTIRKELAHSQAQLSEARTDREDLAGRIANQKTYIQKLKAQSMLPEIKEEENYLRHLERMLDSVVNREVDLENKIESLEHQLDTNLAFLREPEGDLKRAIKDALKRHVEGGSEGEGSPGSSVKLHGGYGAIELDPAPTVRGTIATVVVQHSGELAEGAAKRLGASDEAAKTTGFLAQVGATAAYGAALGATPGGIGIIPGAILGAIIGAIAYGGDRIFAPISIPKQYQQTVPYGPILERFLDAGNSRKAGS